MFQIKKIHWYVLLGLILLNLAFFAVNLNDFFLSDDFDWLDIARNNEHSLIDYFSANYYGVQGEGGTYRPMYNMVFSLNNQIGGLNPLPYHLTNLMFHIGVCFLVYLLVLILFDKYKEKNKTAILAAVFFTILPSHSEAVIWISAIGDPMATFFYLLSFYLYILFRKKQNFTALLISIVSFVLALLTKEIAITLPLLIVVWEIYQLISGNYGSYALFDNKTQAQGPELPPGESILKNIVFYPLGYWIILIGYFLIRFVSIGLVFGYYASETIKMNFTSIFEMITALIIDNLFYGQYRVWLTDFFTDNKLVFVYLLVIIVTLILIVLRKYKFKAAFLIDTYIILILPVVFLSMNNLSDEGERYGYLASVAFVIILSALIWQIKKEKYLRNILIVALIVYFSFFLLNKNHNWQVGSELSQKIVLEDLLQVVDLAKENYFVAMPDNLAGVPIMRNGIILAAKIFQPQLDFKAINLGAYQRLDRKIYNNKVLYWGPYPTGGYIAETFDNKNWVTGYDRQETDDYIFELWNYDYPTYTSNTIRLILKNENGEFIPAGKEDVNIIIFDQGGLRKIK
jgi:protein O-mannosyl-transferase